LFGIRNGKECQTEEKGDSGFHLSSFSRQIQPRGTRGIDN
jgi:hypothetical protein